jgi:hypothetical protein
MIRSRRALAALAALVCCWTAGPEPLVGEPAVVEFQRRIESFYRRLEGRSLDVQVTFEDRDLREFFSNEEEFSDYYAALADEVRRAGFQYGRPTRVEVLEFRFEGRDRATVDVKLSGRHSRALRFWEVELRRGDTWERRGTTWLLSPKRL